MRKGIRRVSPSVGIDVAPEHELYAQNLAQRQRGQMRLKLSAAEIDEMVTQFVASRGSVTVCPPAYVCTSRQYHPRQGGELPWRDPVDASPVTISPLAVSGPPASAPEPSNVA
ncbi:MAG TPA: hypothetical protein VHY82_15460 [Acetobacteraceae bacterium]|jgi:hypothetical protein|nr:hypothetical protein [Acetobacteraceae bacterium]